MELRSQHAVVTGGGTGIGIAITRALVKEGARVTIASRNIEHLEQIAASDEAITAVRLDVTDPTSIDKAFATIGDVDILVNNAGAVDTAAFQNISSKSWHDILAVNLTGPFLCTQAALPSLRSSEFGRIINIASTAGLKGYAYNAAYCAAKHGIIGMTKTLALELVSSKVTANCICPGFTDTAIVDDAVSNITSKTALSEKEAMDKLLKFNPQGRLIDPDEVASAVLWLCQPSSRSITGQAIAIAGGEVM